MVYFDNAATTKPSNSALEAMINCGKTTFGNPSSLHGLGISAEKIISNCKKTILNTLSLEGEVVFTSGGTESNNLAITGIANTYHRRGKKIITTTIEHPSVARTMDNLQELGFEIIRVKPSANFEEEIANLVDRETILVSAMAVNSETGFRLDTKLLHTLIKRANSDTFLHVDGVQGFCKTQLQGDLISISSHKIHGVKGVGALYIKKGVRISPLIFGGGQQGGIRSGTEPVELIAAFDEAINSFSLGDMDRLHSHLLAKLGEIPTVTINSFRNLPNITNFSVKGIKSEIMLHFLEGKGFYVSSGSACSKGRKSEVLKGFGIADTLIDSAIRVSFSHHNTTEEIDEFITALKLGIERFSRLKGR